MGRECFGDLREQLLARAAQEAAMRGVLHQRVLKAKHRVGRRTSLEHQLGRNEASESSL